MEKTRRLKINYLIEKIVRKVILETREQEIYMEKKAKEYLDYMIEIHKTPKAVRQAILDNLVNSPLLPRASNSYVQIVWSEYNRRFPS